MPRKFVPFRLVEPSLKFYALIIFMLLLGAPTLAQTTTDVLPPPCNDNDYQNCTALQGVSPTQLDGPLVYSFASDAELLAVLGSQQAVDDFKSRARTAASDWATRAGVTVREASGGETSNVSISASNSQRARDADAFVEVDPNNSNNRNMVFSDEYTGWSVEGRDSTFSHEWGHIIGLPDVTPDQCPGVDTIMRQTTGTMLQNGYNGGQPALNRPTRPANCDLNKGRAEQTPPIVYEPPGGGGGGGGYYGGGGGQYCQPEYEWQSWQVCVSYGGTTDCDRGYDLVQVGETCYYTPY